MNVLYECMRCKKAKPFEEVAKLHTDNGATFFACLDCMSQAEAMVELVKITQEMGLYDTHAVSDDL